MESQSKKLKMFQGASSEILRKICLEEGADDAGFVEIDRKELALLKKKLYHYTTKQKQ